ncbi:MAG: hypothetical protein A2V96_01780 [Candidatus Yonathbacteria bacterium RBG_16_43_6]|uniref:Uncharacterized protein n=2 Tax=Parcubacteria group TaxID=1794811 RepID=A0A1G2SEL9_9BACT|nr:MAG: hypothetical protein UW78_C0005G0036 [Candidatus Azambacteria bacterium GW2011_GWA1_44_9]OHA78367.1 MAG: hypothetical protein A2V96_01780 [Candidatus Yonathbacteria bacterium RBG_16_43_6]OHA79067.1 MAG: hypothetical protein A2658_01910 [Candidatus Yonathbacteria bacterium RIFCSPHIGHO2_01_FULL_44_19]OHA83089.1 MAG: hypothetical protein A3B07_00860 [Candidatus Yonathbacteria bacterium RIFCSPLOWO2_01_FULL_43_27]
MNIAKKVFSISLVGVPSVTLAAVNIGTLDFKGLVAYVLEDFIKPITVVILSLAVVYFLWNIFNIIRASKKGEELADLKSKALWGVIAIFVMVSMWGLVSILVNTLAPGAGIPVGGGPANINFSGFDNEGTSTGGVKNFLK